MISPSSIFPKMKTRVFYLLLLRYTHIHILKMPAQPEPIKTDQTKLGPCKDY